MTFFNTAIKLSCSLDNIVNYVIIVLTILSIFVKKSVNEETLYKSGSIDAIGAK